MFSSPPPPPKKMLTFQGAEENRFKVRKQPERLLFFYPTQLKTTSLAGINAGGILDVNPSIPFEERKIAFVLNRRAKPASISLGPCLRRSYKSDSKHGAIGSKESK